MSYPYDLSPVALYLRKSRADLEAEARGEGDTLSKHRKVLLELARKYRYGITDIFEEIVSGERIIDRPEMQRMLHSVQEGSYKAVLCMDLDRLGRGNMIDQGLIQEAFKSSETLVITPRKLYNLQDEFDEEYSEFESFMARRELKIITRRLQRGRRMSAADGRSISKKPPYGYMRDERLHLHPHPEESKIVKLIFQWALEGLGNGRIANRLTDMKVMNPSGKQVWDKTTVNRILSNEVYIGRIIWGKGQWRKGQTGNYIQKPITDRSKWTIKENAHEPLVSQEDFDAVKNLSKKRALPLKNGKALSNPLAGIIFCAKCGRAMRRQQRYDRPFATFLCTTYQCNNKGSRFEYVEQKLIDNLEEILDQMYIQMQTTAKPSNAMKELTENKIRVLEQSITDLQTQQDNLHDLLERGIYTVEKFLERNQQITERIEKANMELETASKDMVRIIEEEQRIEQIIPTFTNAIFLYKESVEAEEKNRLLRQIVDKVIYTREQEWKRPDQFELEVFLKV